MTFKGSTKREGGALAEKINLKPCVVVGFKERKGDLKTTKGGGNDA